MPSFRTKLQSANAAGSATYVAVPAAAMRAFGGRKRVPVTASVNGVAYRTTVCDMGLGPAIPVRAEIRRAAGIEAGDRVAVTLELDLAERTVEVPADVSKAMTANERKTFDAMSYTHRKEYLDWVGGAKKLETRARRIEKMREALRDRAAEKATSST